MKIQIAVVVVLKDVSVLVDKFYQRASAWIDLIAKVFNSTLIKVYLFCSYFCMWNILWHGW